MSRLLPLLALLAALGSAQAQGPARYDILSQCPALAEQLPERLASAKTEIDREGVVRVQLVVDAKGLQRIESIDGPRRYQSRVRTALQGLDCRTAEPQRHVLNLDFNEQAPSRQLAAR